MAEINLGKVAITQEEMNEVMLKSGGDFKGDVTVPSDIEYGVAKVRNVSFATQSPDTIPNGEIVFIYEE